jgi:uncharacterized protein YndB with AHSA1/START domain
MGYPSRRWTGAVDVSTEIVIACPRSTVAAFAAAPGNAPAWYANIETIEWRSEPPLRVGSRVAFVATFLGRRLAYTYEVVEYVPNERIVMRTAEGPFPMETTYAWSSTERDGTRMVLRNRGHPHGLAGLIAPVVAAAMRRANRADLLRLKAVLERRPAVQAIAASRASAHVALVDPDGNEIPIDRPA